MVERGRRQEDGPSIAQSINILSPDSRIRRATPERSEARKLEPAPGDIRFPHFPFLERVQPGEIAVEPTESGGGSLDAACTCVLLRGNTVHLNMASLGRCTLSEIFNSRFGANLCEDAQFCPNPPVVLARRMGEEC
jgi:hypothetical protein